MSGDGGVPQRNSRRPLWRLSIGERRDLLVELTGVVAGILIALAVNEAVQQWHWKQDADEARQLLHEEMSYNAGWFAFRVAVAPCLSRRLELISAHVEQIAAGRAKSRLSLANVIYGGRLNDQMWTAVRDSGTLQHMSFEEQRKLAEVYNQQSDMRIWQSSEGDNWVTLGLVGSDPATLSDVDVSQMRTAIISARRWARLMESNAAAQLGRLRGLGIPFGEDDRALMLGNRAREYCAEFGMMPASY